tara:strand:+ start:392 stop:625 length:234 start_codon:yes stop_codon:yes gene_type:complete
MYVYLLFVLIGILLFLLFNNKNKFSIGFQSHSDNSQSGDTDDTGNTDDTGDTGDTGITGITASVISQDTGEWRPPRT